MYYCAVVFVVVATNCSVSSLSLVVVVVAAAIVVAVAFFGISFRVPFFLASFHQLQPSACCVHYYCSKSLH